MSGGIEHLVLSGPLVLAAPVALAAGAVTFISPCCLPLVPGYLSYVTGMSGADAQRSADGAAMRAQPGRAPAAGVPAGPGAVATVASPPAAPAGAAAATRAARGRTVAGTAPFVLGFSALFASYGAAFGGLGELLLARQQILIQVLGGLTILLGLLFAGAFDKLPLAGRVLRPSVRPRAGLAGRRCWGCCSGSAGRRASAPPWPQC
jgi:cytochrome c-type biogenesis protein